MIGILGGTFDPVHYGHLRTAIEVYEIFALDHVRLIPCAQPPHKELPLTSAEIRLHMLSLALKNQPNLVVDRRELDRPGYSYMIDTLKSLSNDFSDTTLILFIGTDAFHGLTQWHQWQNLFEYAHIVGIPRPGYKPQKLSDFLNRKLIQNKEKLTQQKSDYLFFQSVTQLDISASAIRHILESGLNPDFLLPKKVIEYIQAKKLYLPYNDGNS
jgi:nicotinate-nucleotide adenylyltransferase